jgi:hypothetical protein
MLPKKHPERQEGEVFLKNATPEDFYNSILLKTKRMGARAYDDKGNLMPGYVPVFVQERELIEAGLK